MITILAFGVLFIVYRVGFNNGIDHGLNAELEKHGLTLDRVVELAKECEKRLKAEGKTIV